MIKLSFELVCPKDIVRYDYIQQIWHLLNTSQDYFCHNQHFLDQFQALFVIT